MRLLSTRTYELESFDDWNEVPPYAILSHRWEEGEVLFSDIANIAAKTKPGWSKILGACTEAEKLGIFHVWIDTCCIFKESSAELSESINSMFAWYRGARICFAYIGDSVSKLSVPEGEVRNEMYKSKWWTRGWTLQELIAPKEVMFFDNMWKFIDFRSCLAEPISKITGIDEGILREGNLDKLHDLSIAHKFSWAARRETTRVEDRAYSLMGLFGVNMSMLYGEGEQAAFYRLQKEIFAVYADHSIFAWHHQLHARNQTSAQKTYDLLAPSLSAFADSRDIINEPYDWNAIGRPKLSKVKVTSSDKPIAEYSSISHGMRIQMLLESHHDNYYLAYLACRSRSNGGTLLGLILELEQETGRYYRTSLDKAEEFKIGSTFGYHVTMKDLYVAAPRTNFALLIRPVRYQCNINLTNAFSFTYLTFMDDVAIHESYLPVDDWPPGFRISPRPIFDKGIWNDYEDSTVIYRHKETAESFAVILGANKGADFVSQKNNKPLLATVVDDINSTMTAKEVIDAFMDHPSHSFTDLSTQMLVKKLTSGKKVMLSVNITSEKGDPSYSVTSNNRAIKLWLTVKEFGV